MADETYVVLNGIRKTLEDMGDGTYAERVAVVNPDGSGIGSVYLASGTDRSGAITAGGTAQQLAAANASRRALTGQNISSGDLWINETGDPAAADTAGSYKIAAGATFEISTSLAVSIIGSTTGQKFTATEI